MIRGIANAWALQFARLSMYSLTKCVATHIWGDHQPAICSKLR